MISYELAMGLALLSIIMMSGSLDLKVITEPVGMVLEVGISQKEQVYPMVPAGWHNDEMLGVKFNA